MLEYEILVHYLKFNPNLKGEEKSIEIKLSLYIIKGKNSHDIRIMSPDNANTRK